MSGSPFTASIVAKSVGTSTPLRGWAGVVVMLMRCSFSWVDAGRSGVRSVGRPQPATLTAPRATGFGTGAASPRTQRPVTAPRAVIGRMPEQPALGGAQGSVARWSDGRGSRAGPALDAREGRTARRRRTPRRRRRRRRRPAAAAHRRGGHRQDPASCRRSSDLATAQGFVALERGGLPPGRRALRGPAAGPRATRCRARTTPGSPASGGALVDGPRAPCRRRRPDSGDAHRQRRLLVLDAVARLAGLADDGPVLLALEDLHWCDELSLDVDHPPGPPAPSRPMLVVGTLRTDELHPTRPCAPGARGCCCSGWPRRCRWPG